MRPPAITEILSWARPFRSAEVDHFCELYLDTVPGMWTDEIGNRMLDIGTDPATLWSCHTDTVHAKGGRQNIIWSASQTIELHPSSAKPGNCLGADDGAGIWILLHMIQAGVPGRYIFHAGEEKGGIGSAYIAKHAKHRLAGIKMAAAFDRKGTGDLIYEQMVGECASKAFAQAFSDALNGQGLKYSPSPHGSFTDTANYADDVPECVNISCGYEHEHGPRETLNYGHLNALKNAMLKIGHDIAALPCTRVPGDYGEVWSRWTVPTTRTYVDSRAAWPDLDHETDFELMEMVELLDAHPFTIARLLLDYGVDADEIRKEVNLTTY